jgi:hypothetical protein
MALSCIRVLAATSVLALAGQAAAVESMAVYDDFNAAPLAASKWFDGEKNRTHANGTLSLRSRDYGLNHLDTGRFDGGMSLTLARPARVSQMKATVVVNSMEVGGCAGNATPSQVRARLAGTFFNTGNPVEGTMIGDLLAQVVVGRVSTSGDAPGVLQVYGAASVCEDAECVSARAVGPTVNLGTVALGQAVTVQMEWDKTNSRFTFTRDNGAAGGQIAYTQSDDSNPSRAFRILQVKTQPANCTAVPTVAAMDANFSQFQVNTTGR